MHETTATEFPLIPDAAVQKITDPARKICIARFYGEKITDKSLGARERVIPRRTVVG